MEGSKVYIPHDTHVWLPAEVVHVLDTKFDVRVVDVAGGKAVDNQNELPTSLGSVVGQRLTVDLNDPKVVQLITSRTVQPKQTDSHEHTASLSLPMQNETEDSEGFRDMIALNHLHEAAILYNLRHRFFRKLPYTYTGHICLAVNPYQWLDLYGAKKMEKYRDLDCNEEPHVYLTSTRAFIHMRKTQSDQSILVSGESGAGKTEATKIVMAHLADLSMGQTHESSKVIQRIIKAHPLLESFGNAKTLRNDNSSRFGKFTELQFNKSFHLIGARSRTYLLEKSRVTRQNDGERNFHIFYQLLSASPNLPHLKLNKTKYHYVKEDASLTTETMSKHFLRTTTALTLIGLSEAEQKEMLAVLSAIVHLGEIDFVASQGDVETSEIATPEEVALTADQLEIPVNDLAQALCTRLVHVNRETFIKPMTVDQAFDSRDAIAKALYSKLFDWLVERINVAIGAPDGNVTNFVGILDIFGFENFEHNSFEQLCINYANEKLQQKFVQDTLKTIQVEYDEEGIDWSHIAFEDNQAILDVIEGSLGIISLLNEESMLGTGSDAAFANKLAVFTKDNPLLRASRLNTSLFTIAHYAGDVTYDSHGFLEKHRDTLRTDIQTILSKSLSFILSHVFAVNPSGGASTPRRGESQGGTQVRSTTQKRRLVQTLGAQFKQSLAELMDKVSSTNVHYIRCIKPNASKSPFMFEHRSVVAQLRSAGVVEAIRVSRSAYPTQMLHRDMLDRFTFLVPRSHDRFAIIEKHEDLKVACACLCQVLLPRSTQQSSVHDKYQVGLTRVYFRDGILDALESIRVEKLSAHAVLIQKRFRGYRLKNRYQITKRGIVVVQALLRRFVNRRRFLKVKRGMTRLQAVHRGWKDRTAVHQLRLFQGATKIQAAWKRFMARKSFLIKCRAILKMQSFVRMSTARVAYLKNLEAQQKQLVLGSKIARLQSRLGFGSSPQFTSTSKVVPNDGVPSMALDRPSLTLTKTLFDESSEVISALQTENDKLRLDLEQLKEVNAELKTENRKLREWQNTKEIDSQVKTMAQKDQQSKDLAYLIALEKEFERLRKFICETNALPMHTGLDSKAFASETESSTTATATPTATPTASASASTSTTTASSTITSASTASAAATLMPPSSSSSNSNSSNSNNPPPSLFKAFNFVDQSSTRSLDTSVVVVDDDDDEKQQKSAQAVQLLLKSSGRLDRAKKKLLRGSARRVQDYWDEIHTIPPPMKYTLGSVPWKRLLTDWAQGNPKKLDYMTRWLKNILEGGPIEGGPFPLGVELKSVSPMMFDGFMQLVIPKLAERQDITVHVHTKEHIGTSMRITLGVKNQVNHAHANANTNANSSHTTNTSHMNTNVGDGRLHVGGVKEGTSAVPSLAFAS